MSADQEQLGAVLDTMGPIAVAVSGGVDSMTLAALAHRHRGPAAVKMVHALSPAVPPEATARVEVWAAREGWELALLDAKEFDDPNYRANPLNRCFFCKTNLYGAIAGRIDGQIVSGTNMDDLGEYRPGLDAARNFSVRHPYVEAGIDKRGVRTLARLLGLGDVAELPASPCLSSRVETSIRIEPETLTFIHGVEKLVSSRLGPRTVRCRVRASGIVVELDMASLEGLSDDEAWRLRSLIGAMQPATVAGGPIAFAPYRTGSAFVDRGA